MWFSREGIRAWNGANDQCRKVRPQSIACTAAPNLPPTTPPHPQRQRGREGRPANGNASDESSLASRVQTAAAPPSEPCGLLLSNPQHGDEFCRRRPERFGGHSIHSIHNARGHSKETKFAQVFVGAICRSHMLIWGYQVTLV